MHHEQSADADDRIWLDLSDLSGDHTPTSLTNFLADNAECPPDDDELAALREIRVGQTARLAIGGGGYVTAKRVPPPARTGG